MKRKFVSRGPPFRQANAPKTFGGREPPGPAGSSHTALPQTPLLNMKGYFAAGTGERDGRDTEESQERLEDVRGKGGEERGIRKMKEKRGNDTRGNAFSHAH
jgi:hypothetical protein